MCPVNQVPIVANPFYPGLGVRGLIGHKWFILLALLLVILALRASAAGAVTEKNVLILESFTVPDDSLGSFESELRARVPWPVNFYVEYLESRRFDDDDYARAVLETLHRSYGSKKLDLVMAVSYPALQLAVQSRDRLFPGAPIAFWGVDVRRTAGQKMWRGVTGVTEYTDARATIELALRLHPGTNTLAIITENSAWDKWVLSQFHAELARAASRVNVIDLAGLPTSQLLESVAALPPHTVVFLQEAPQASSQLAMGLYEIFEWVGKRLPTYSIFPEVCLNHGCIGGARPDYRPEVSSAAAIAGRLLSGEPADNIPVVNTNAQQVLVDWRQLRRWHIPESALPPGSEVLYRVPTLWERYRKYIIAALVLIVAQSLLIVALLMQRARKRKAEAVLRESEKRFRVLADTTPSMIWMCDREGRVTYQNERLVAFTGRDANSGYDDTWTAYLHPDDLENVLEGISRALKTREPFSREYRLRRQDGVYRWMFDVASPRVNGDGLFAGFIGSAIDMTDQKLAEVARREVAGRLMNAQEDERARIARELHDSIGQSIALLVAQVSQYDEQVTERLGTSHPSGQPLKNKLQELGTQVSHLSHQLHSSELDYLGLSGAIEGLCAEFSEQYSIDVECSCDEIPGKLDGASSLALFRVTQEALHNVAKHSQAGAVNVSLTTDRGSSVVLLIQDDGIGFSLDNGDRPGLGLISMRERVHLVGGDFAVNSSPGGGTTLRARIPLPIAP